MEIESIETLNLKPKDILVIKVDMDNMPNSKTEIFMKRILEKCEESIQKSGLNNQILVLPKTCDVSTISKEDKDSQV